MSTLYTLLDKSAKILSSRSEFAWTLIACVSALPWLFYIVAAYINLDFWHDEIYTLDYFVFVPISTIVTDYRAPNNHIFFNILNHLYIHGFGIDYSDLLREPWKIRILMLFYTFLTFIYVYKIVREFFGFLEGFLAVIILGSTLPFINFTIQVRGYTLSMTLLAMILYYNLHYYRYGSRKSGFLVVTLTSLLFYTIPSNIYIIASIFIYWLSRYLFLEMKNKYTQQEGKITYNREKNLAIMIILGTIVATIWYIPILPKVIDNNTTRTTGIPRLSTTTQLMPVFLEHLISKRHLLIPMALYGLLRIFRRKNQDSGEIYLFLALMVFPFLLSTLRGDKPFDRTFIPLVVPFSMVGGISLKAATEGFNCRYTSFFLVLTFLVNAVSFTFSVISRDRILLSNIESGKHLHDITNNYYQNYYRPSALMKEFAEIYQQESIFIIHRWDKVAMPKYLIYWLEICGKTLKEWHKSPNLEIKKSWIRSKKPIYVFTNDANVQRLLESRYPDLSCKRITSPGQLGMVIECNHRDQLKSDQLEEPSSDQTLPWVTLGRGWYAAEYTDSIAYRWGSADNTLWLVNPYDTPIYVTLALTLGSYETTRPVELWHDRRLIARWDVQRLVRTYRLGVTAPPGQTRLRLRAPTTYDPQSQRELSVIALKVQLADYTATESK
jgi:hypothetical protein